VIVSLVAAVADNGVIGVDGGLPWRLPDDLRHFRELTTGHTVIMGRRTWDEIRAPLRNRRNLVVTRNPAFSAPGAEVVASLEVALDAAAGEDEVFVIGGGEIYRAAIGQADRLYLTHVHASPDGDTRFPSFDPSDWRVIHEAPHPADSRHPYGYTIRHYERTRR